MTAARDTAAQPERTRLAWRRTALTATVTALLAARFALVEGESALQLVLTALIALTWVGFLVGVQRRIFRLRDARPTPMNAPWPLLAALTVLLLTGLAALMLLLSPLRVGPGHTKSGSTITRGSV